MKKLVLLAFVGISFLSIAQNDSISTSENSDADINDLNQTPTNLDIVENSADNPEVNDEDIPQFLTGDRDKSESAMMKYIIENLVYPKEALQNKIEGKVRTKFTISSSGEILNVHIVGKRKLGYGCEEEAIRVIKSMPKWKQPAKHDGVPVSVDYYIPIKFKLN